MFAIVGTLVAGMNAQRVSRAAMMPNLTVPPTDAVANVSLSLRFTPADKLYRSATLQPHPTRDTMYIY